MTTESPATLACNLCESRTVSVLSRRSRSGQPMRTVGCEACGLVWTDPRPHDVRRFYESDYRLEYKGTFEPKPKHVLRAGRVALSRLARIEGLLSGRRHVLDVGSGGGEFAYLLANRGLNVTGVEPNAGYAGYSRREYGLRVHTGFIDEAPIGRDAFDLITIWHVLEHTEDPAATLARLAAALRPDGRLVVEVPNVEATCQAPASRFHEAHLYSFNPATLRRMAERVGLVQIEAQVSEDGGNLTSVFARAADPAGASGVAASLPGNFERVREVVARHTGWRHWTSLAPYRRAIARWTGMLGEQWALRDGLTGRARLDRLYQAQASQPAARPAVASLWLPLLGAYAFALLAEWVLTDHYGPALGLSEQHALIGYLSLQALVLGALLFVVGARRGSVPDALKIGGLMLPVFTLPAVC